MYTISTKTSPTFVNKTTKKLIFNPFKVLKYTNYEIIIKYMFAINTFVIPLPKGPSAMCC